MTEQQIKQMILDFKTSPKKDKEKLKEILKFACQFNEYSINEELGSLFFETMWNPTE